MTTTSWSKLMGAPYGRRSTRGCRSVRTAGTTGSGTEVGRDDDLDALELLDVGVARRRHGAAQGPDDVRRAVGLPARTEEDLLERGVRAQLDALAPGQLAVVRLGTPVVAGARGVARPREGGAEHHRVGAARDRLDDVTGRADAAVGDDVDVAPAGLVEVVATGGSDVGDSGGHRGVDAQGGARRVRRPAAEADEDAGRSGAHEVQGRRVGGRAADDDRNVEL